MHICLCLQPSPDQQSSSVLSGPSRVLGPCPRGAVMVVWVEHALALALSILHVVPVSPISDRTFVQPDVLCCGWFKLRHAHREHGFPGSMTGVAVWGGQRFGAHGEATMATLAHGTAPPLQLSTCQRSKEQRIPFAPLSPPASPSLGDLELSPSLSTAPAPPQHLPGGQEFSSGKALNVGLGPSGPGV